MLAHAVCNTGNALRPKWLSKPDRNEGVGAAFERRAWMVSDVHAEKKKLKESNYDKVFLGTPN